MPDHPLNHADHGRIEVRRAWVGHDLSWPTGPRRAAGDVVPPPGLSCLAMIEATLTRDGRTTTTHHYHLSSRPLRPEDCLAAARAHWSIENSLHWVLDVTFDEDRDRTRKDNAPENLSILRKPALNMLKRARPEIAVRRKRKRSGWSNHFARSTLGQMR